MPLEMFWSNISAKNFNCHCSILKETKSKSCHDLAQYYNDGN